MTEAKYDKNSVTSIYEFALKLTGKSLAEAVQLPEGVANLRNRGDLGSLVEKYYFKHTPPNNHDPDFKEAGLELKTTGVLHRTTSYKAKERLVVTMIDYESIVDESWETSVFYKKCRLMLILFYHYAKEVAVVDRQFVLDPLLYEIPLTDIAQIRRDWEFIRQRVLDGKAHELSEGDTYYLGACRKGSGGEKEPLRKQPFSSERAKARAFSFKQGYVNQLIEDHIGHESSSRPQVSEGIANELSKGFTSHSGVYRKGSSGEEEPLSEQPLANEQAKASTFSFKQGQFHKPIESLGINAAVTFDDATKMRFRPYIGLTVGEISKELDYYKGSSKGFLKDIANRILAIDGQTVLELDKAGIEMKTIRLTRSGKPRESMSFPGFKFLEIINEDWEDSSFHEKLEHKFLLVIFREDENGIERLFKVDYWNMPYKDRLEAKRVWEETKRRVSIDASNLPKMSESNVAHVRPKAKDGQDKLLTPQGDMQVKKCFWLNSGYIASVVAGI